MQARGRHRPFAGIVREQVELELGGHHRDVAECTSARDDARKRMPRIGRCGAAVELEHAGHDLGGGPRKPGRRRQRAGDRAAQLIGVTDFPDEPGLDHVLAGDV